MTLGQYWDLVCNAQLVRHYHDDQAVHELAQKKYIFSRDLVRHPLNANGFILEEPPKA